MQKRIPIFKLLSILIGVFILAGAAYFTFLNYSQKTRASVPLVTYSLRLDNCQTSSINNKCALTVKKDDPVSLFIELQSTENISAAEIMIRFNNLADGAVLEYQGAVDTTNSFTDIPISEVHKYGPTGGSLLHQVYVNKGPDTDLKKTALIGLQFTAIKPGKTHITLITGASKVVGPVHPYEYELSPQNKNSSSPLDTMQSIFYADITVNPLGPPIVVSPIVPSVIIISPIPSTIPEPPGNATINYRIKLQGISTQPKTTKTLDIKVGLYKSNALIESKTITFSAQADGAWVADTQYSNIIPANDYYVVVKGPKHLQKRVCDNNPRETVDGTYRCKDGKISLKSGVNTLDFSNIFMLAGDTPLQNGVIDSVDITFIRNNRGGESPDVVARGDLNYDGRVDSQDYVIVINALSFKYDETE